MKRKQRLLPSPPEAAKGARLALTNARRHLRGADALAGAGLYGLGVSHLVLCLEEVAKAAGLVTVAFDLGLPEDVLQPLLTQHGARHAVAFGDFFVFVNQFVAARVTRRLKKEARRIGIEAARERYVSELVEEVRVISKRTARTEPVLALFEWIAKANDRKNAGFYVDYVDTKWRHPGQIKPSTYYVGRAVASAYLRRRSTMIRQMLSSEVALDEPAKASIRELVARSKGRRGEDILKDLIGIAFGGGEQ